MNRIKELRKNMNLTLIQISKILGVTDSAFSLWETGKREPDNKTLHELSKLFNVTIDYLLGNSEFGYIVSYDDDSNDNVVIPEDAFKNLKDNGEIKLFGNKYIANKESYYKYLFPNMTEQIIKPDISYSQEDLDFVFTLNSSIKDLSQKDRELIIYLANTMGKKEK